MGEMESFSTANEALALIMFKVDEEIAEKCYLEYV
jgi:hypothetical protein